MITLLSSLRPGPNRAAGSRHRLLRRAASVALCLVFMSGWAVDAGALHPCPHHQGSSDSAGEAHAGPASSPDAGHHHGAVDHVEEHDEHDSHEGPCTCRTDCTGATPVRAANSPSVERLPERGTPRVGSANPAPRPARILLPHILPWPTAPPRSF